MSTYGISAYTQNGLLNCFNNQPFVVPSVAVQFHTGAPVANGTLNVSGLGSRQLVTFTIVSGVLTFTGDQPTWTVATAETEIAASFWDSLSPGTGNFLFSGAVVVPETVANGDVLTISQVYLPLTLGLAS